MIRKTLSPFFPLPLGEGGVKERGAPVDVITRRVRAKGFLFSLCLLLLQAVLLFSISLAEADESSTEPILERMAEASRALTSLEADLVQVKSYPQLSLTDPPEIGRIHLQRAKPTRLRFEITEPESRIVTVDDGEYVLYQPKIKQAMVGKLDPNASRGRSGFLTFLVGDLSSAEEDFEIVLLGEEEVKGKQAYHLRLTARPETESMYRQIDLWVDQEIWLPVRQELVELNNSVSRIDLENVVLNQIIEDSVFKLDLPSDVERVKG